LWIALILTALAAYILGMGMPPAAVYLTLAILVIPALIKMGITTMASHMFAFYFGAIAAITPPVAMAAFAGAALSGGNPAKTGYIAMRIGIASYVIPFIFAYCPELLFDGPYHQIILAFCTATIGAICLAAGVEGWLFQRCTYFQRALLLAAALLLIKPGIYTDLMGLAFFGLVIFMQKGLKKGREAAAELSFEPGPTFAPETGNPLSFQVQPAEKTLDPPRAARVRPSGWKGWILFLPVVFTAFWLTYKGVHFTYYWLFLVITAALSFTLVLGYTFFMKPKNSN
jgi:hypothetical protein